MHLLIEIICKGGNLALNIAPEPTGRLPRPAVEQLKILGSWLKTYGEAVYGTRICAPYKTSQAAFVQKNGVTYAFVLAQDNIFAEKTLLQVSDIRRVTAVADGKEIPFETTEQGIAVDRQNLPLDRVVPSVSVLRLER